MCRSNAHTQIKLGELSGRDYENAWDMPMRVRTVDLVEGLGGFARSRDSYLGEGREIESCIKVLQNEANGEKLGREGKLTCIDHNAGRTG